MELFNENGITTPAGIVATTPEEAEAAYKSLGNRKSFFECCVEELAVGNATNFRKRKGSLPTEFPDIFSNIWT